MQRNWKLLVGGLALASISGTALADRDIGLGVSIAVPGVSAFVGTPPETVYVAPPAVVYRSEPPPVYYAAPAQEYYAPPSPAYYAAPGASVYYGPSREEYRGRRYWHRHRDRRGDDDDD